MASAPVLLFDDILEDLFKYFSEKTLLQIRLVCTAWNRQGSRELRRRSSFFELDDDNICLFTEMMKTTLDLAFVRFSVAVESIQTPDFQNFIEIFGPEMKSITIALDRNDDEEDDTAREDPMVFRRMLTVQLPVLEELRLINVAHNVLKQTSLFKKDDFPRLKHLTLWQEWSFMNEDDTESVERFPLYTNILSCVKNIERLQLNTPSSLTNLYKETGKDFPLKNLTHFSAAFAEDDIYYESVGGAESIRGQEISLLTKACPELKSLALQIRPVGFERSDDTGVLNELFRTLANTLEELQLSCYGDVDSSDEEEEEISDNDSTDDEIEENGNHEVEDILFQEEVIIENNGEDDVVHIDNVEEWGDLVDDDDELNIGVPVWAWNPLLEDPRLRNKPHIPDETFPLMPKLKKITFDKSFKQNVSVVNEFPALTYLRLSYHHNLFKSCEQLVHKNLSTLILDDDEVRKNTSPIVSWKTVRKMAFSFPCLKTLHLEIINDDGLHSIYDELVNLEELHLLLPHAIKDYVSDEGITGIPKKVCEELIKNNTYKDVDPCLLRRRSYIGNLKKLRCFFTPSALTNVSMYCGLADATELTNLYFGTNKSDFPVNGPLSVKPLADNLTRLVELEIEGFDHWRSNCNSMQSISDEEVAYIRERRPHLELIVDSKNR